MPVDRPEPFGLAMIEAMACGTPVLAFNRGSIPEIVDEGVTGFVAEDEAGAVAAVSCLRLLSRALVRKRFAQRFTAGRMAADYVRLYRDLVAGQAAMPPTARTQIRVALPASSAGVYREGRAARLVAGTAGQEQSAAMRQGPLALAGE